MAYTFTTEAERTKIKMLCDLGMSVREVHKLTGRSCDIITRIANGTYEERKKRDAERMRQLAERNKQKNNQNEELLDNVIVKMQAQEEERKRQETRRRIREEAEKAGAPTFTDEEPPERPKVLQASPFSYDTLLRRVADGIDYNNALLNGVLNKLDMMCKALGVGE